MKTARAPDEHVDWISSIPFIGLHVAAAVGVALVGVEPRLVLAALISYVVRQWAVLAGYHRYFSHRAFRTSRAFQLILAVLGTLAVQKGPLWWSSYHRHHHRHSDEALDIHSPYHYGFLWSHMGWILCTKYKVTKASAIPDLMRYPELRWLDRWSWVPPAGFFVATWWLLGPAVFVWACLIGTVACWHLLFSANSVCHMFGRRRFATNDDSRNSAVMAFLLLGEGWHNNHHFYPRAARQGFYWWEWDPIYYSLKVLEALRVVHDVHGVPPHVLARAGGGGGESELQ